MKLTRLFVLAGVGGVCGCTGSWLMPTSPAFDACRTQCAALEDLPLPGCLIRRTPFDELRALVGGVYGSLDTSIQFQEGACGCFTATIDESGRFANAQPIHSWLVDDPDRVVSVIEGFQSDHPIPERATCLVGLTVPIRFVE